MQARQEKSKLQLRYYNTPVPIAIDLDVSVFTTEELEKEPPTDCGMLIDV